MTTIRRRMCRRRRRRGESVPVDVFAAIDRFLASPGLAESTRRSYGFDLRDFGRWLERRELELERVDARALADYTTELGRDRRRLAPATITRRLAAVRSFLRFTLGPGACPTRRSPHVARAASPTLRRSPRSRRSSATLDGTEPLALRNAALVELVYSCGLRSAEAVALDLGDADFEREALHVRGKGGKERVVPLGEEAAHRAGALPARRAAGTRAGRGRRAVPLGARAATRHEHAAATRREPAPAAPRVRDAPARGRRRPAHDPGAPRPRVALDDADLQPRRREAPAPRLRPRAPALVAMPSYGALVKEIWQGRIVQAAAKYGEVAPTATVCCNACRTCVQTNLAGLAIAAVAAQASASRASRGGSPGPRTRASTQEGSRPAESFLAAVTIHAPEPIDLCRSQTPTPSASCSSSPRNARRGRWMPTAATSPPSRPSATARVAETTTEEIERWIAQMRADGLAATTIAQARRGAAILLPPARPARPPPGQPGRRARPPPPARARSHAPSRRPRPSG